MIFLVVLVLLACSDIAQGFVHKQPIFQKPCSRPYVEGESNTRFTRLAMAYGDEEGKGLSIKVIGGFLLGIFGLFGSEFVNGFKGLSGVTNQVATELKAGSSGKPSGKQELKSTNGERGALTRLSRREINAKLQNLPVFFMTEDGRSVFLEDQGESRVGKFFTERADADNYAENMKGSSTLKVSATTMDEVYYPLITKQQKMGSFVKGVAGSSDTTALYRLQPSDAEVAETPSGWKSTHDSDLPLFRITNLAFNKPEGLEIPLFVRKSDGLSAFDRLQKEREIDIKTPEVQVTSIKDLVGLFSQGGFEGRAIELYPSIDAIEAARSIILPAP